MRPLATIFAFLFAALPGFAQWRHFGNSSLHPTAALGFGGATAVNPLGSTLDPGWTMTAGAGLTNDYAGVLANFTFVDFGITRNALVRQGAHDGSQKYWAVTIDPVVHVNGRGPVDFYLTGGGGIYGQVTRLEATFAGQPRFDLTSSETHVRPGVDGGAGFAFNLDPGSRLKVFVEARYHHMFTAGRESSFIPVVLGVRF